MTISISADDRIADLPRTLRHKGVSRSEPSDHYAPDLEEVAVTRLKVPFFRLAFFLIKCVLAGIPALILLGAILWGMGELIEMYAPWLLKMKILIDFGVGR